MWCSEKFIKKTRLTGKAWGGHHPNIAYLKLSAHPPQEECFFQWDITDEEKKQKNDVDRYF